MVARNFIAGAPNAKPVAVGEGFTQGFPREHKMQDQSLWARFLHKSIPGRKKTSCFIVQSGDESQHRYTKQTAKLQNQPLRPMEFRNGAEV